MDRLVCVYSFCPDRQKKKQVLLWKIKTFSCTHTIRHVRAHIHTSWDHRLSAGGSAASPSPFILFSISLHPFLHLSPISLSLLLSERVTFLPSPSPPSLHFYASISMCQCSESLPPISLFPPSSLRPLLVGQLLTSWPDPLLLLSCSSQ